jgi:hypothetical protein
MQDFARDGQFGGFRLEWPSRLNRAESVRHATEVDPLPLDVL